MITIDMSKKGGTIRVLDGAYTLEDGVYALQVGFGTYDLTGKTVTAAFAPKLVETGALDVTDGVVSVPISPSLVAAGINHVQFNIRTADTLEQSPMLMWPVSESILAAGTPTDDPGILGTILADIAQAELDIDALETGKVDKVTGYGLSQNDFTDALESKLNGIESGANLYVHPVTHAPSIIAETVDDRFVSDTQINTWNGKQDAIGFTPENVANKKLDLTDNSDTYYPSQKAVKTAVDAKLSPTGSADNLTFTDTNSHFTTDEVGEALVQLGVEIDSSEVAYKKTSSNPLFYGKKNKMVGHRGVTGLEPENTIPSFERAGKEGFWGCEADIRRTSDGEFVCMHDATVDRTTNGTGNVVDLTLAQIKALTVDSGTNISAYTGLTVPTLREYLETCLLYNMVPFLHISVSEAYIQYICAEVKEIGFEYNCVYIVDSDSYATEVELYSKSVVIGAWYQGQDMSSFPTSNGFKNGGHADIALLTTYPDILTTWHNNGVVLGFWSVTSTATALSAFESGADWVQTDSITPKDVMYNQYPYNASVAAFEKTSYGVVSGLLTEQQTVADMTVKVSAGVIHMASGDRFAPSATASLSVTAADATNPRIDIVYVSSTGVVSYLAGTAAASPSAPSVPSGGQKLAEIYVTAGKTSILTADIRLRKKNIWTEDWITPTLLNGWASVNGTVQYYKDTLGIVHFRGCLNPAAKTGTTAFTLPAGYRPGVTTYFNDFSDYYGLINTSGSFVVDSTKWKSLLDISFRAEN